MPIPAAAGVVASVVYASGSAPLTSVFWSAAWLGLMASLSFLMVSTWRYWSFKELNMLRPRSTLMLVAMCAVIFAIWNWSQPVLLIMAATYMLSGVVIRLAGLLRRLFRSTPRQNPETQVG